MQEKTEKVRERERETGRVTGARKKKDRGGEEKKDKEEIKVLYPAFIRSSKNTDLFCFSTK